MRGDRPDETQLYREKERETESERQGEGERSGIPDSSDSDTYNDDGMASLERSKLIGVIDAGTNSVRFVVSRRAPNLNPFNIS